MRTKKIVAILIGVVLVTFGIGLLSLNHFGVATGNNKGINIGLNGLDIKVNPGFNIEIDNLDKETNLIEKNIDEEIYEEISGIDNIDIDISFSDINIIPEERENIKIHYSGYIKAKNIPKLKTNKIGNVLKIDQTNKLSKSNTSTKMDIKLDIYIPENYKNSIKVNNNFGNIKLSKLALSKLDIYLNYGDIDISDFTGNINADINYGDLDIDFSEFNNNIDIRVNYGDVRISLPNESQFNIDAKVDFGDINMDFPVTVTNHDKNKLSGTIGNSSNNLVIKTSFGDIEINRK